MHSLWGKLKDLPNLGYIIGDPTIIGVYIRVPDSRELPFRYSGKGWAGIRRCSVGGRSAGIFRGIL